jgi:MFS family permease
VFNLQNKEGKFQPPETRVVVALGVVSFFNDLSSEVIARILPIFLLLAVKTSFVGIGIIEAIAEGTSVFAKLFAGVYSDRISKRKPFVFAGYALSVLSRPLIVLFPTLTLIGVSRFFDKVGKGIRTAPRDALISDLSSSHNRGFHYGITRSLDTLGAVLGLGTVALYLTFIPEVQPDILVLKKILIAASIAGVLALFVLWFGVYEPKSTKMMPKKISFALVNLDKRLKYYLVIAIILALASSSDAFIIVRARELHFTLRNIILLLTAFNLVSAASAYYLSELSDRVGRKGMLILGWILYAASYFTFGLTSLSIASFCSAVCLYGLFYGLTDGVEKAMVADFETDNNKGVAFGFLGLVNGLGIIPANLVFGYLYKNNGATLAFWTSGVLAFVGACMLLTLKTNADFQKV